MTFRTILLRHYFPILLLCSLFFRMIPAVPACGTEIPEAGSRSATESTLIGGPDSGLINLLLVGQDRRKDETCSRADSMILCTFHPESKEIIITSFLRDLYVQIPGYESNRLNAAYALGGTELLQQTLKENFGIHTDGALEVDFSRFSQIIDTLGGVTLMLRQDEADSINKSVSGNLTEGTSHLNGEQALAYSRIRNLDGDGDFSRTERQRKLLSSLLDSYRDASLLKILSVVADMLPIVSTEMEKKDILYLAVKLFPMLDDPIVTGQRIPADGTYSFSTIRNMEVLVADATAIRNTLQESLIPD